MQENMVFLLYITFGEKMGNLNIELVCEQTLCLTVFVVILLNM